MSFWQPKQTLKLAVISYEKAQKKAPTSQNLSETIVKNQTTHQGTVLSVGLQHAVFVVKKKTDKSTVQEECPS